MLILCHGFSFKTLQTLLPDTTLFQESVRREPCLQCVHVTQMEQRTGIYTISKLSEEGDD